MVLFENIKLNQRVEIRYFGHILRGTVKYTGSVYRQKGDWVGVALKEPIDEGHTGQYRGRWYFEAMQGCGLFVKAADIRFMPQMRCIYNSYRTVSRQSEIEEPLFTKTDNSCRVRDPFDPVYIEESTQKRLTKLEPGIARTRPSTGGRQFPLNHTISRTIPAATATHQYSSMGNFTYTSRPIHSNYGDEDGWERSASIPPTHMPKSAMESQVNNRGLQTMHWPRVMAVDTARDYLRQGSWNNVSY